MLTLKPEEWAAAGAESWKWRKKQSKAKQSKI